MRRPRIGLGGGSGSGNVADRTMAVSGIATGVLVNIAKYLPGASWTKFSDLPGVTIATNGDASVIAAIGKGSSVAGIVTGTLGSKIVQYGVTLQGAMTVPDQIGTVTATAGNGQVALAWSPPANGGSAITDYRGRYKPSASSVWMPISDAVSATTGMTATALTNGVAYDFDVVAVNAVGPCLTPSVAVSATPSLLLTAQLSFSTLAIGSSSTANTSNDINQDGRGTSIPTGQTWQDRSKTIITPLTSQTLTVHTVTAYAGNGNNSQYDTLRNVKNKIGDGTYTQNGTVCEFGSSNLLTAYPNPPGRVDQTGISGVPDVLKEHYDTTASATDWVKRTQEAIDTLGANTRSIWFWIYPVYSPNDQRRMPQWTRGVKYYLRDRTHHKMRGIINMYEGILRSAGTLANHNQNDLNGLSVGYCTSGTKPFNDTAHSNSPTYDAIGVYEAKIKAAMNGGVPFVATYPIYKYLATATGSDEIADLYWTHSHDLDNCSFSVDNTAFTVERVARAGGDPNSPYRLVLKLIGALPPVAPLWLNLTITRTLYGSETYRLPVSIDNRVAGSATPQPVLYRQCALWYGGRNDDKLQAFFPANTTKLTAAFILRMEEVDGQQIQFTETGAGNGYTLNNPASGTANATSQTMWVIDRGAGVNKLFIRKTAVGQLNLVIYDENQVAVFNYTTAVTGGVWHTYFGYRLMSIHIDTAGTSVIHFSGGRRTDNGQIYPVQDITLPAPAGTGLLALAHATSDQSAHMRFFQDVAQMPSQFLTCTRVRIWIAPDYVTPNQANWDLIFDETAQKAGLFPALPLGGDKITWGGITPLVDLKGSAASDVAGCDPIAWTDLLHGGQNCPNDGTGPSLLSIPMRPLVNN